jgi:SAM-dependent methyltransferase
MVTMLKRVRRVLAPAPRVHVRPGLATARGIARQTWQRVQEGHELNFWVHEYPNEVPAGVAPKAHYRGKYWPLNHSMFGKGLPDWRGCTVLDAGCGPFGSIDLRDAGLVIGLDPLATQYQDAYGFDDNVLILASPAEAIPLLDRSVDAVVCVNALDHFFKPYEALAEMWRVLRVGGRFVLATDVGGAPAHPCNIQQADLDAFFAARPVGVIEHDCGLHIPSSWSAADAIPNYVFQGVKR